MKKFRVLLCMVLALVLCVPIVHFQLANAGKTGVQIEDGNVISKQATDEIISAEWKFKAERGLGVKWLDIDGNVTTDSEKVSKAVIRVEKTYDLGNPFLSRTSAMFSEEVENGLTVDFSFNVREIKGDKQFGFVFGLPRIDKDAGELGSTFFYFKNDNGTYKYGATNYGETETQVVAETEYTGELNDVKVQLIVTESGKLNGSVNGVAFTETAEDSVNGNGYLGFAQKGSFSDGDNYIDLDITQINILNEYYANPENPEITIANFDNSEFNTEEWYINSTRVTGTGVVVDDGKLKFNSAGQNSMFATKHKYSNFELEYDIGDAKNYATIASNGWVDSATYWQGIEFGRDASNVGACASNTLVSSYLIYFDAPMDSKTGERTGKTSVNLVDHGKYGANRQGTMLSQTTIPDKYGFMNAGFEGTVRVKLSVRDGIINLYVRLVEESAWFKIFSYQMKDGYTPVGYVILRGEGNQFVTDRTMYSGSTYSLDNIVITNYDAKPQKVEVGFTSNVLPYWTDYKYVDTWTDDYLIRNTKGKGTKSGK